MAIDLNQNPDAVFELVEGDRVIVNGQEMYVQIFMERIHLTIDVPAVGIYKDYPFKHLREKVGIPHRGCAVHYRGALVDLIRSGEYNIV